MKNETKYSEKELAEFKLLIDKRLSETLQELDDMKNSLSSIHANNDNERWNPDEGNATNDSEFYSNQISRLDKFRLQLEAALFRIETKTYGVCLTTGKLIDKKRLLAVPTTTQSIEAKLGKN